MKQEARIGIIGGSGLGDRLAALGRGKVAPIETPFGKPSGPIELTELDGVPVALLSRHGPGHLLNPTQVPYRANLYALKALGVTHLIATGAVGSLSEEIEPRDLVVPNQVIDRTFRRAGTFFESLAVHVELAQPFCPNVRELLAASGRKMGTRVHPAGTYLCMEGPQLSTRAESELYRSWGADLVGMTAMPEARLAREAELCYALIALPTDYDCWRPAWSTGRSLLEEIGQNLKSATENAVELIRRAIPRIAATLSQPCACQSALSLAIWSDRATISPEVYERMGVLLARHRS